MKKSEKILSYVEFESERKARWDNGTQLKQPLKFQYKNHIWENEEPDKDFKAKYEVKDRDNQPVVQVFIHKTLNNDVMISSSRAKIKVNNENQWISLGGRNMTASKEEDFLRVGENHIDHYFERSNFIKSQDVQQEQRDALRGRLKKQFNPLTKGKNKNRGRQL